MTLRQDFGGPTSSGPAPEVTHQQVDEYLREHPDAAGLDVELLIGLEEARRRRPDLSDAEFAELTRYLPDNLMGSPTVVSKILACIAALRPVPPTAKLGRPKLREAEVLAQVRAAIATHVATEVGRPTKADVAAILDLDPKTISNWAAWFPSVAELFLEVHDRPEAEK